MWLVHGFLAVVYFSEYIVLLNSPILILLVLTSMSYMVASVLNPILVKTVRLVQ